MFTFVIQYCASTHYYFNGKVVCSSCSDGQTGIKCQNRTGHYLDYSFLTHSNYTWIGGLLAFTVLVIVAVMVAALFLRRKR